MKCIYCGTDNVYVKNSYTHCFNCGVRGPFMGSDARALEKHADIVDRLELLEKVESDSDLWSSLCAVRSVELLGARQELADAIEERDAKAGEVDALKEEFENEMNSLHEGYLNLTRKYFYISDGELGYVTRIASLTEENAVIRKELADAVAERDTLLTVLKGIGR